MTKAKSDKIKKLEAHTVSALYLDVPFAKLAKHPHETETKIRQVLIAVRETQDDVPLRDYINHIKAAREALMQYDYSGELNRHLKEVIQNANRFDANVDVDKYSNGLFEAIFGLHPSFEDNIKRELNSFIDQLMGDSENKSQLSNSSGTLEDMLYSSNQLLLDEKEILFDEFISSPYKFALGDEAPYYKKLIKNMFDRWQGKIDKIIEFVNKLVHLGEQGAKLWKPSNTLHLAQAYAAFMRSYNEDIAHRLNSDITKLHEERTKTFESAKYTFQQKLEKFEDVDMWLSSYGKSSFTDKARIHSVRSSIRAVAERGLIQSLNVQLDGTSQELEDIEKNTLTSFKELLAPESNLRKRLHVSPSEFEHKIIDLYRGYFKAKDWEKFSKLARTVVYDDLLIEVSKGHPEIALIVSYLNNRQEKLKQSLEEIAAVAEHDEISQFSLDRKTIDSLDLSMMPEDERRACAEWLRAQIPDIGKILHQAYDAKDWKSFKKTLAMYGLPEIAISDESSPSAPVLTLMYYLKDQKEPLLNDLTRLKERSKSESKGGVSRNYLEGKDKLFKPEDVESVVHLVPDSEFEQFKEWLHLFSDEQKKKHKVTELKLLEDTVSGFEELVRNYRNANDSNNLVKTKAKLLQHYFDRVDRVFDVITRPKVDLEARVDNRISRPGTKLPKYGDEISLLSYYFDRELFNDFAALARKSNAGKEQLVFKKEARFDETMPIYLNFERGKIHKQMSDEKLFRYLSVLKKKYSKSELLTELLEDDRVDFGKYIRKIENPDYAYDRFNPEESLRNAIFANWELNKKLKIPRQLWSWVKENQDQILLYIFFKEKNWKYFADVAKSSKKPLDKLVMDLWPVEIQPLTAYARGEKAGKLTSDMSGYYLKRSDFSILPKYERMDFVDWIKGRTDESIYALLRKKARHFKGMVAGGVVSVAGIASMYAGAPAVASGLVSLENYGYFEIVGPVVAAASAASVAYNGIMHDRIRDKISDKRR